MTKLSFTKMHGCGNDYIYFDCFRQPVQHPEQLSILLSDRHKSIGGDGIVLICPSDVADGKMRMFNIDGSEGKMCGNAIRCVGKYLYEQGYAVKDTLSIETLSGIKTLYITADQGKVASVTVDMGKAVTQPSQIPVLLEGDTVISRPLTVGGTEYQITCVSMGNPHCVVYVPEPASLPLSEIGPLFERHPLFPEQVNTEFIRVIDRHTLEMRVWERGSGETMACGTGACAAVTASVLNGFCPEGEDVTVRLRGGELVIQYTPQRVLMTGNAQIAFTGVVELPEETET
ncbi:MAG: diaminopimelate epimerase [Clostridia bacterium]|nr:diaminopimelate epimerase [Clostridia bacterium]